MYHFAGRVERVSDRLSCRALRPSRNPESLHTDARNGLLQRPRSLPPKYFYDARGSGLFDRICDTPEYYLTRTENALLTGSARDIIRKTRPRYIVELGSGTARKTRHLLNACHSERCYSGYVPFDVCREVVVEAGERLVAAYPWLHVTGLIGDYQADLAWLPEMRGPRLFVFLGSTIGNLREEQALAFLSALRAVMGSGDGLLLGADRVKDPLVLHRAYNDKAGLTAEFNRNLLRVLNRELAGNFDLKGFHHHACYNPRDQQVEMYLVAKTPQRVTLSGLGCTLELDEGEAIHTEISRKFTLGGLDRLLADGGFRIDEHCQSEDGYFSLVLARPCLTA